MKFIGGLVTGLLIGVAGTIMTMAAGFFDPVLPEPAKKDEWGSFPARPQVEFLDDGRTVRVFTYSPLYDRFLDEPGHNFTITLD